MGIAGRREIEPRGPFVPRRETPAQADRGSGHFQCRHDLERLANLRDPGLQKPPLGRRLSPPEFEPLQNGGAKQETNRIVGRQGTEQHARRIRRIGALIGMDFRVTRQQTAKLGNRRAGEDVKPRMPDRRHPGCHDRHLGDLLTEVVAIRGQLQGLQVRVSQYFQIGRAERSSDFADLDQVTPPIGEPRMQHFRQ